MASNNSIAGIYGVAKVSNKDSTQTLAYGVYGLVDNQKNPDNNYLSAIGVHGRASGLNSIGVLGFGQNYGIYGQSPGYAGYFDGNIKVTNRATLAIPNIPVFNFISDANKYYQDNGISSVNGDLIYVRDISIMGGLRIYVDGQWQKAWRP